MCKIYLRILTMNCAYKHASTYTVGAREIAYSV